MLLAIPAEIEAALVSLEGIERAVVRGEPDPKWGQIVSAQVTWRPDIEPLTQTRSATNSPGKSDRNG